MIKRKKNVHCFFFVNIFYSNYYVGCKAQLDILYINVYQSICIIIAIVFADLNNNILARLNDSYDKWKYKEMESAEMQIIVVVPQIGFIVLMQNRI